MKTLIFLTLFFNPVPTVYADIEIPVVEEYTSTTSIRTYIEQRAVAEGVDPQLAVKIVACESNFNQYATNTNRTGSKDHGLFQVNDYYHKKEMEGMGLDILNWKDTTTYGFRLLKKEGTKPWNASKKCWSKV